MQTKNTKHKLSLVLYSNSKMLRKHIHMKISFDFYDMLSKRANTGNSYLFI